MNHDLQFDYEGLYTLLLGAARTAFTGVKGAHPDETFYAYALYTAPEYSYVHITLNSEEGLTRTAVRYLEEDQSRPRPYYAGFTLEDMRLDLRDSPDDMAYYWPREYDALFDPINKLASAYQRTIFRRWQQIKNEAGHDAAFSVTDPYDRQFRETCFSVLRQLDSEGLFGTGEARSQVRVNLLMGDQNERDRQEYAAILNPPIVCENLAREYEAVGELWRKHRESRNP